MYISKIQLQGFKSFLKKTELAFGEGITALVGPNGCGKSNIVDAIRWVLGEQKTSILRSSKMEDVIFNGTKNRKSLSFCEAAIFINNNRKILPLEYTDIEITRRLYRDGESEFYINKTPCRLKDIHNLFIDTGMSSNAYSVIELKMIDAILSNNAAERKYMFEEAAGINNYKHKRHLSIRKIEANKIDMERVNDIIREVNKNIKNLESQINQYEEYNRLYEKIKNLEFITTQGKIQIIQQNLDPVKNKLNLLKKKYANLTGQMNLDETLIEKVDNKYKNFKDEFYSFQAKQSMLENKINNLNSKILVWSEKLLGNNNQELHFKDECSHIDKNILITKGKIDQLIKLKDKINPKISSQKKNYISMKKQVSLFMKNYDKELITYEKYRQDSDLFFLGIREKEAAIVRLKENIKERQDEIDLLINNIERYRLNESENISEIDNYKKKIKQIETENTIILKKIEKNEKQQLIQERKILSSETKLNNLNGKKVAINEKIKFYDNIISNNEMGYSDNIRGILKNKNIYPYVIGVLSDMLEVPTLYSHAVESALGEFSNYIIVDNKKNAQHLVKNTKHQISVIALENVAKTKRHNNIDSSNSLLSKIKCNQKIYSLLVYLIGEVHIIPKEKQYSDIDIESPYSWVSTTGEYYKNNFIFKSIGEGSKKKSFINCKQELNILRKELLINDKLINREAVKINKANINADLIRKNLKDITGKLDLEMRSLGKYEKKTSHKEFILIELGKNINNIKKNIKNIKNNILDCTIKVESNNTKLTLLKQKYDKINRMQVSHKKLIDDLRINKNILQEDFNEEKFKMMELKKEKEGILDRLSNFKIQNNEFYKRREKYKIDLQLIKKENKTFKSKISNAKNKLEILNKKVKEVSKNSDLKESDYNRAYKELQLLQSDIRNRQKSENEILEDIKEYEISIYNDKNMIKQHRQRILDLYNENLPDVEFNINSIDISVNEKQILKLRQSLESIGPVNMVVMDDYNEEKSRQEFLNKQYKDLQSSEKLINETIEKLDREAKIKFENTFNEIKKNFIKTFSMFFNGGEGHLRLSGSDPFDSEIEIIARPPGKKTQTLRMLSTGEKALTAIALLFAIYLVKPSPFCILDEIDAPLDDNNVDKFTAVLKNFSDKTQFIVVTHNKLTMEKADYMYGVTQEEEGVSKIVSVMFKNKKTILAIA